MGFLRGSMGVVIITRKSKIMVKIIIVITIIIKIKRKFRMLNGKWRMKGLMGLSLVL